MPFKAEQVEDVPGLLILTPAVFGDDRGFFMEAYNRRDFFSLGIRSEFVQVNHSKSSRGVLRGLHYQTAPMAQSKLVRCLEGEVFDVAVDIRKGSPSFGKWYGLLLSEGNKKMFFMPRGFAHGFLVMSESAQIEYMVDEFYSPSHERGIIWNDPDLNIKWSYPEPLLSEKDARNLPFAEAEYFNWQ